MTKEQTKQIKDHVWYIKIYLDDLEYDIKEGEKPPEDLQDYLDLAEQRMNEIEKIIHTQN